MKGDKKASSPFTRFFNRIRLCLDRIRSRIDKNVLFLREGFHIKDLVRQL